jgi:hypothetical protein
MTDRQDIRQGPHTIIVGPEASPADKVLYMYSRCHLSSPTWTKVDFTTHEAVIECAECGTEIARLKLAEAKD